MVEANTAIIPSILNHPNKDIINQIDLTLLAKMIKEDKTEDKKCLELIKSNKNPAIQLLVDSPSFGIFCPSTTPQPKL